MSTLNKELAKILSIKDETACAEAFEKFCKKNAGRLPMPGEDTLFDKAMWAASEFMTLSKRDEDIVNRVTRHMLGEQVDVVKVAALKLRDLVGSAREATAAAWQEMLGAMAWQQMVPAGALRGVGAQIVSLGTFQKQVSDANVQVNLGWLVDQDQLRILLQAKDEKNEAMPEVEIRIQEVERGVIFTRKTNEDGTVVAPNVYVGPGQYRIEVVWDDQVAQTPYFMI